MNRSLPWEQDRRLTEERLATIARAFLDIYYGIEEALSTPDDCQYTRGASFFGRARNRLIAMAQSSQFPWLTLANAGMDITCEIDGLPFRFFRDDHDNPKKKGFWRRNACDQLFASDETTPVIFRFIVERPIAEDDSPEIYFIGYNSVEIAVTEWRYGQVPVFHTVDETIPKPVPQGPAPIDIRRDDEERKDGSTGSQ